MSLISQSTIDQYYGCIKNELKSLIPLQHWAITPNSWCFTKAKTKYGMADRDGVIHINQYFLGSQYQQLLEAVLRHEFAHLCVGLQQGHNKKFKQCERLFKAQFNAIAKQQASDYLQQVNFKYLLQAELMNGQFITIKKVHRKHRNYINYRYSRFKTYYYRQHAIKQFLYIDIE